MCGYLEFSKKIKNHGLKTYQNRFFDSSENSDYE